MIDERMDETGILRKAERTFFEYLNAFTIETRKQNNVAKQTTSQSTGEFILDRSTFFQETKLETSSNGSSFARETLTIPDIEEREPSIVEYRDEFDFDSFRLYDPETPATPYQATTVC